MRWLLRQAATPEEELFITEWPWKGLATWRGECQSLRCGKHSGWGCFQKDHQDLHKGLRSGERTFVRFFLTF